MKCEWQRKPEKERGIICGCNQAQEWLLPWWWERYSSENKFPVTFIDFGLSEQARNFCRERGELITLNRDSSFVKSKDAIDPALAAQWEAHTGVHVWTARHSWFKKPFALLHSAYVQTIWLDLDCEVLTSIASLFSDDELGLVREYATEHLPRFHPDIRYNGGVLVFRHGSKIIQEWAQAVLTLNGFFEGDDNVLSHLIHEKKHHVTELPEIYNWRIVKGVNLDARIVHWLGQKNYIMKYGGIKGRLP